MGNGTHRIADTARCEHLYISESNRTDNESDRVSVHGRAMVQLARDAVGLRLTEPGTATTSGRRGSVGVCAARCWHFVGKMSAYDRSPGNYKRPVFSMCEKTFINAR